MSTSDRDENDVANIRLPRFASRENPGDIDLLVVFQPDAAVGLVAFNQLRRELEAALGHRVDLVPKDGLKPIIRDEVPSEAQILYAA